MSRPNVVWNFKGMFCYNLYAKGKEKIFNSFFQTKAEVIRNKQIYREKTEKEKNTLISVLTTANCQDRYTHTAASSPSFRRQQIPLNVSKNPKRGSPKPYRQPLNFFFTLSTVISFFFSL